MSDSKMTYREAVRQAIREAMIKDERVFLMGEDVGAYGGSYAVSKGLLEEFGEERIRDTPLSESGFVGAGIGAALGGMRPIIEIMTVNFSFLALDQIVNTASAFLHMSGGQFNVPVVIRMGTGAGRQLAAQHSMSLEGWYGHIPGLRILAPATVQDARGMLQPALDDPDPVLIFENASLYNMEGDAGDQGAQRTEDLSDILSKRNVLRNPLQNTRPELLKQDQKRAAIVRRERLLAGAEVFEEAPCLGREVFARIQDFERGTLRAGLSFFGWDQKRRRRIDLHSANRTS